MKRTCRCGPARRPCPGDSGLGGMVVRDNVDIRSLGDAGIGLLQEAWELPGPMVPAALADDETGGDIGGCEQRGRDVALAVAGPPFGNARPHRRHGSRAVEHPYPAPSIAAEHQRPILRLRMEVHGAADLVRERGITGGLGGSQTCGRNPQAVRMHRIAVCGCPPSPAGGPDRPLGGGSDRIQAHGHVADDPSARRHVPPLPIPAADMCPGHMARIFLASDGFPAGARPTCANYRDVAGAGNTSMPTRRVPETTVTRPNGRSHPGYGIDAGSAWSMVMSARERWPSG